MFKMKVVFFSGFVCFLGIALTGCGKKEVKETEQPAAEPVAEAPTPASPAPAAPAPRVAASQEPLPGASGVRQDLKNKNYAGAVEGFIALKSLAMATGGDAWQEYRQLNVDVGTALRNAAKTDPAAAQAYAVYSLSQAR